MRTKLKGKNVSLTTSKRKLKNYDIIARVNVRPCQMLPVTIGAEGEPVVRGSWNVCRTSCI